MTEKQAVKEMRTSPGAVSASVANDPVGWAIAILSGGGPFSHVRGSDIEGNVLENNGNGVMEYQNAADDDKSSTRLTFVSKKYADN